MAHIIEMVSEVGEHTDGPLKGQVPFRLVPLNHVFGGGNGTVKVLVSAQQDYFILHFDVKNWQAAYGEIQPYTEEQAQKLMKIHLQALGRWSPLQTVHREA